jgi:hypothetical protein
MNEEQADKMIELLENISTSLCTLNDRFEWENSQSEGIPASKRLKEIDNNLSTIKYNTNP